MKKKIYLGLFALLAMALFATKTKAQTINYYQIDTAYCGITYFTVNTSTVSGTANLEIFFGDGTNGLYTLDSGIVNATHIYGSPGIYTIKMVTMDNGNDIDSVTLNHVDNQVCNAFYTGFYLDANANCIFDAGDLAIYLPTTMEIDSAGHVLDTVTVISGYTYLAHGPTNTVYSFKILSATAGYNISCPSGGIINDTVGGLASKYFGYTCNGSTAFDLGINANFSVGVNGAGSHITVYNQYCTPEAATLTINYSDKYSYDFNSGNFPTTVNPNNSITMNIGTISSNSSLFFVVLWDPVGTLTLGDTACATFTLDPISGDVNPANNIIETCDTIRLSHDPNYKSVLPEGNIDPGTKLAYTISFENTGNDTAFNIHIQDTLSSYVDPSTLKMVSTSAPMNLSTSTYNGQTILKFDFPHIDLLDSSHHGLCDGMVSYTINAKTGLAIGTKIDNNAGIYFDVNTVVMTNTVENKIGTPASVGTISNNARVSVYPNPADEEITINADNKAFNTMDIVNNIGQILMEQSIQSSTTVVNISKLPAGLYYVKLRGNAGTSVQKFEKL